RPIEREIDRRRSIEEEKGKKKRKRKKKEEGKKEYLARAPSSPACRHRPRIAHGRGRDRFFSRVRRRRSVSQRGDIDRGDVTEYLANAVLARLPSPPVGRLRAVAARGSLARGGATDRLPVRGDRSRRPVLCMLHDRNITWSI
ncbi:hypothetical protein GW17_00034616, partial [Ensete ventricosum]